MARIPVRAAEFQDVQPSKTEDLFTLDVLTCVIVTPEGKMTVSNLLKSVTLIVRLTVLNSVLEDAGNWIGGGDPS